MTTQTIRIRDEMATDITVITEVTIAAFKTLKISNHTEQFIIESLRSAKALTLSLVAEVEGVVGFFHARRFCGCSQTMGRAILL